jgi:hypothetical protein
LGEKTSPAVVAGAGATWGEIAVALLARQWGKTIGRGCDEDSPATSIELAWRWS